MLATHIANKPRSSPAESANDPERTWIGRQLKRMDPQSDAHKVWLAYKLAIPVQALDDSVNPGFAEFAKRVHLEKYLATFGHTLQVESDYKISILYQNTMRAWSEIPKKVKQQQPIRPPAFPKLYNPSWPYGKEGIQSRTYYQWIKLKPFKTEDAALWNREYRFEICTLCTGKFRIFGDHTWVRLRTPKGEIYSFGIYREDNELSSACSRKRAFLQSPDISEFWDEPIHTLSFKIDEAKFQKIKNEVEKDRGERIEFHVLRSNCTAYAIRLADQIGIQVSADMSFARNLLPESLRRVGLYLIHHTPKPIQGVIDMGGRVLHHVCAAPFNLLSWALGGVRANLWSVENITYPAPFKMAYEPSVPRETRCVKSTTWGGVPWGKSHGANNPAFAF